MKTVNYYPAATPGPAMWQPGSFDPVTIGRDMLIAKGLGFGELRIFLAATANVPDAAGAFNMPQPLPSQLARLKQVSDLAARIGMGLHLSLFDMFGAYGWLDQCKQWAAAIASTVDHSVVTVVELQNETKFSSATAYRGGYGTGWKAHADGNVGQVTQAWARAMLPVLKALWPSKPVSVSVTGLPSTDLAAARKALGSAPDFYDWHCYPSTAPSAQTIVQAQQIASPMPLQVGEYGCPSITADGKASEAGQAGWMANALTVLRRAGIEPAPWCLYDNPAGGQAGSYGLLGSDGRLKPAADLYLP